MSNATEVAGRKTGTYMVDTEKWMVIAKVNRQELEVPYMTFRKMVDAIKEIMTDEQTSDMSDKMIWYSNEVKRWNGVDSMLKMIDGIDGIDTSDAKIIDVANMITDCANMISVRYEYDIFIKCDDTVIDKIGSEIEDEINLRNRLDGIENEEGKPAYKFRESNRRFDFSYRQYMCGYTPEKMDIYMKYKMEKYKDKYPVVNILINSGDIMKSMYDAGIKILSHRTDSYFKEIAKLCIEMALDMVE